VALVAGNVSISFGGVLAVVATDLDVVPGFHVGEHAREADQEALQRL
jgi:hypothetical protein